MVAHLSPLATRMAQRAPEKEGPEHVLQQPACCCLTALVILSVLSTCQACFHRALRSGRQPRLPSAADNRRPCVKRGKLRGFSLLLWRDLWLEAVLSEGSGDTVNYKPVLQAWGRVAIGSVCQWRCTLSWRSLGTGIRVGFGCGSAFLSLGELPSSVKRI